MMDHAQAPKLFLRLGVGFALSLSLTACQIYRNNGRNLFESAVPTPSNSVGSGSFPILAKPNDSSNCWAQPKDEALWFAVPEKKYLVQFIDAHSIEVCFEASSTASSTSNP